MNIPTRKQSIGWLSWAEELNPGPWIGHVRSAARAAEAIAGACGMNAEAAWHMGLLHDIGYYRIISHEPNFARFCAQNDDRQCRTTADNYTEAY